MDRVIFENLDDNLLPEYDFDYSKAKPNRFRSLVVLESQVINSEEEYDRALSIAEPLVANHDLSNE